MSRTVPGASFPDRLFLLPPERRDPDLRLAKSMALFVTLAALLLETLLMVASGARDAWVAAGGHLVLALVAAASLAPLRHRFRRSWWLGGLVVLAWASSALSLAAGFGAGTLLWHLLLPTAVLFVAPTGPAVGVLVADLGLTVAQALWCGPAFARLFGGSQPSPWFFLGWESGAILLFLLFVLFHNLIRQTMTTFQDDKGRTLDLLVQTKDSESRWADQARFLETLMDVIPFPLYHKGPQGRYLSANASFRVVFDVQDVIGRRSEDFLGPENAATLAKIELDVLARDSMAVEETVLVHADGTPHDFIVYLMPFVDGGDDAQGHIGVLIDISERKTREQKLVQLNATKDQLFSIISHDLRGPIGKLKQLFDIYIDDPGIFDKATWDQVFHDMRRSSDSLFQLLENLLSWARAQQGDTPIRYEALPLEPLVSDIFSVLKLLATEKRITLEMKLNLKGPLLSDRHVLSTIVRNLVHNALKFSMPGGKITVTAEENPEDTWIEVRDQGVGMAPEAIERIFRKRERVSTFGTGKEKGQGIGLGLCQDLAAGLGAHLEVTSRPGEGTAIRLHLPTPEL